MAGRCWLVMLLASLLSSTTTLAAVDQSWLSSIVEGIKDTYTLGDTFSVAVNIPQNQDPNDLQQVLQNDPADSVSKAITQGQVYKGTRVVAAANSQALSHVLQNIQQFRKSSTGNVLIIYSENSPNANDNGIASQINDITQNWSGYAFVFSNVADVPAADTSQLTQAFKHLQISKLGLSNIFRCYEPGGDSFQCTSCSSGGDVTPSCVTNTDVSSQDQGTGTDLDSGTGTDIGTGITSDIGAGIGNGIASSIDNGYGSKGKGVRMSKCKGGSCERKGSSKLGKGGRRRKGKLGKGGRRRKGKLGKGGRRRKGKLGKGGRRRKGKLRKGGRRRKGKLRKGGRRRKGKLRRGRKQKGRRKGRKRGKTGRSRKGKRGGKR